MISDVLLAIFNCSQNTCGILPLLLVINMILNYAKVLNFIFRLGDVAAQCHFQVTGEEVE